MNSVNSRNGTPLPLDLLNLIALEPLARAQLFAAGLRLHDVDAADLRLDMPGMSDIARRIRVVLTNGTTGLSAAQMDALPQLGLVCAFGAGYERIDVAAAARRGIAVAHAPNTNGETVADHALALMLAVSRGLITLDRAVKAGGWAKHRAPRPTLHGARLGVVGLGNIGHAIAMRAEGFGMSVGYHARTVRPGCRWQHFHTIGELADASDFLVLACPGGPATRHLVNAEVLARLGASGFLVNVARGSVVDTSALIEALCDGVIAGAALDVFEDEPTVPSALRMLENVVLTPHVSGRSPAALQAQVDLLLANVRAYLAGAPLPAAVNATAHRKAQE
ncbi:hydroxyacid dehydrogenase [Pandoraea faecigallinarum]|uniref:Hydroxyacid dehydrogenase n=1 Tax=Pandoraea faecigallinarum TaxID=656179 RepID=A0A0H3WXC3_9BURK|nr:2-hydroxyacid dehydrogenase [Pandoraea faecigallinarum]AKM32362.1 hydroxyacid dehydrogenase [Pandoraea faecigallinarum]